MARATMLKTLASAVAGLVFMAGSAANASVVDVTSLSASWTNIAPSSGISVTSAGTTASMRWGVGGSAGQSGYDFVTATTPITNTLPPSPTPLFSLGTFTHLNNPISGTTLDMATLLLTAAISVDSVSVGTFNFLFDFDHDETPNGANPCADGGANGVGVNVNGCADLIDISYSLASDSFSIGGDLYTLIIDPSVSSLATVEARSNSFDILGQFTLRSAAVPAPGALFLMGLGLFGLGLRRRGRTTG